jgi:hypothetical protein
MASHVLLIVGLALVLLLPTGIHSQSRNKVEMPFLFTDDQTAPQSDLADIKPSDVLRTDAYLNGPMTRLEYFLSQMEVALNDELSISGVKHRLAERFEPGRPPFAPERVRGGARYSQLSGKIMVAYTIEGLGRPRSPMRDACKEILKLLEHTVRQDNLGFSLHNTLLGVLAHTDYPAYTPMLQKVASQIVHRVAITSSTEEGNVHHTFACQRVSKDAPITYEKFSYKLK